MKSTNEGILSLTWIWRELRIQIIEILESDT